MKIGWDNYLKDSTVTVTNEDSLFPKENLWDNFLLRKFQPDGSATTVTIEFPEDRVVSMIMYSYNNVTSSQDEYIITKGATDELVITKGATDEYIITREAVYQLKDSSGAVVGTGTLPTGEQENVAYPDSITCRTVVIAFAANETVYVGGLIVTDPLTFDSFQVNPRIAKIPRVQRQLTDGGQMVARKQKALRRWQVSFLDLTETQLTDIDTMIDEVGYDTPVYVDLYHGSTTLRKLMYCAFTAIGNARRDTNSQLYSMGMTMEERR